MIIPTDSFLTHSMKKNPWGKKVARILAASLAAVEPGGLVREAMQRDKNHLHIDNLTLDLEQFKRVILIGIGKASVPMSAAAAEILGKDLTSGIIITKRIPKKSRKLKHKVFTVVGGHPVPDQGSLRGAQEILKLTENLTSEDLVLVLLSGGGSSLLTAPAPGISLEDLQSANQVLLKSGVDIHHMNTVRKHLSTIKGGQLAKAIFPARLVTLILSDVIAGLNDLVDPADIVASGPTMPDPTTFQEARGVISQFRIKDQLPISVVKHLELGMENNHLETPKPGNEIFDRASSFIIGNNMDAIIAGVYQAEAEGFPTRNMGTCITGDANKAGKFMANVLTMAEGNHIKPIPEEYQLELPRPVCVIAGGESTVHLQEDKSIGKGGRNLELALSAMSGLDGLDEAALITLASDGEDGVTGAAGAVVTGESYKRAVKLGLDIDLELKNHNSYHVFDRLDDLIITGPTYTNVNDLMFSFKF